MPADSDDMPSERPLKANAFDLSQGRSLGNYKTFKVKHEELEAYIFECGKLEFQDDANFNQGFVVKIL
jgi:hypothetical protein